MRIVGQNSNGIDKTAAPAESAAVDKTAATLAAAPSVLGGSAPAALESSTLQPAHQALAAMPEIDQAKVDSLRDALARGEISFDADRLATLIQRFHGARG